MYGLPIGNVEVDVVESGTVHHLPICECPFPEKSRLRVPRRGEEEEVDDAEDDEESLSALAAADGARYLICVSSLMVTSRSKSINCPHRRWFQMS